MELSELRFQKQKSVPAVTATYHAAVTRIRTWVTSATTKGTNHYTITAFRNCDFFLASRLNIYAMRIIIPVWLWNTRHHALAEKHMMWVPLCNKCSKRKKTDTFLLCIDFARWLRGYYYFCKLPMRHLWKENRYRRIV